MGLLTVLAGAGAVPVDDPAVLLSAGLLGASLLDRFRGDDDDCDGGGEDGLDDLGGMDDRDDDPFGDGEDAAELENRLEDLETEVASLSSTVNTVRSETEEIAGQVEEIGEDVRSLLDVYGTVIRGIDPSVDDVQGGPGGDLGDEGSFGLFDEDDDTPDTRTVATENGGGESSSELEEEYESGDADRADADDGTAADALDADGTEGAAAADGLGDTDGATPGVDGAGGDPGPAASPEPDPEPTANPEPSSSEGVDDGGFEFVTEDDLSSHPQRPYLTTLPGDYVGDLLVMEWLEYLVEESDATDAVRAVNYYERIEWVDADVADRLKDFLSGFGDVDRNRVDEPGTAQLTLDHHTRSLRYVMQLTDATAESVVIDRWPQLSREFGGSRG